MAYPTSTDSFPTLADGQPAYAAYFNNIHTALVAIETTLGTSPAGIYGDVSARIAALAATVAAAPAPIHGYFLMGA